MTDSLQSLRNLENPLEKNEHILKLESKSLHALPSKGHMHVCVCSLVLKSIQLGLRFFDFIPWIEQLEVGNGLGMRPPCTTGSLRTLGLPWFVSRDPPLPCSWPASPLSPRGSADPACQRLKILDVIGPMVATG